MCVDARQPDDTATEADITEELLFSESHTKQSCSVLFRFHLL